MTANKWELTKREREAARLAATGLTTKAIAAAMGVTYSTAVTHVERAKLKTGCATKVQLAIKTALGECDNG